MPQTQTGSSHIKSEPLGYIHPPRRHSMGKQELRFKRKIWPSCDSWPKEKTTETFKILVRKQVDENHPVARANLQAIQQPLEHCLMAGHTFPYVAPRNTAVDTTIGTKKSEHQTQQKKTKIAASKQFVISQWLFNSRWSTRSPTFIVTKKLTDTNQRTCPQLSFFHSSRFSESACSIIVGMEDSFCRLRQAACISCSWIWFAIQNLDRVVHYHLVLDNQVIERMAMFHQCQVVRLWLEHRILYKAHVVWWHSQHRAHRLHSFHE